MFSDPIFTSVTLDKKNFLNHKHHIITLGSCFSEHIGTKLQVFKWSCDNNPFGTIFNPVSIFKIISLIFKESILEEDGYLFQDGYFFHFDLPSSFYGKTRGELQAKFLKCCEDVRSRCSGLSCLILTLGTAQVYRHLKTHTIVANCHKQPQSNFEKCLLNIEEIELAWSSVQPWLPDSMRLIWTLSPVRHTRETLTINSVSKSILRLWLHQRIRDCRGKQFYFPAFEILLDELRDYRYYTEDLVHPNQLAINLIWKKFLQSLCSPESFEFCAQWEPLLQRLGHKLQRPDAPSAAIFLKQTLALLEDIQNIDLSSEKASVVKRLAECRQHLI